MLRSTPQRRQFFALCSGLLALFGVGGCLTPDVPLVPLIQNEATHPDPDFANLLDAVVRIDVREATFQGGSRRMTTSVGSGVIMTADGFILTNAHVVSPQAEQIVVTLANLERVDATLIGWDHWTDLALIQLDLADAQARELTFSHAQFGESASLYPGQDVLAVGTPNGLTRTVTRGIISNPQRYFAAANQIRGYETGFFNTWLQTDAAINPGNSGGPLVTTDGAVIGINTRSYLGANNLSFAVPSAIAREVMAALMADGELARSYLGLRPAPLQDLEGFFGLAVNEGVLVDSVDPGSPAGTAGLKAGDIVLAVNESPVDGRFPEQLPGILHRIADLPVGTEVTMAIQRNGAPQTMTMTTEPLQSRMGEQDVFENWGLSVQEVSRAIAREQRYDHDDGVFVIGVQQAFPASEAGLNRGDVILSINRDPVRTLDDLRDAYERFDESPNGVLLEVSRNHQVQFVVLKP